MTKTDFSRRAKKYGFGAIALLCTTPAFAVFSNVEPSEKTRELAARLKDIPSLQSLALTGSCSSQSPFAKGYPPRNRCKYAAGDAEVSIESLKKTGDVFSIAVSKLSDFKQSDGFPLDETNMLRLYRALCQDMPADRAEAAAARLPQRLSGIPWSRYDDKEKKRVPTTLEIHGASRHLIIEDIRGCRAAVTETNERGARRVILRFRR